MFIADLAHLCIEALIQLVEYEGAWSGTWLEIPILPIHSASQPMAKPDSASGPECLPGTDALSNRRRPCIGPGSDPAVRFTTETGPIIFLEDCYKRYVGLVQLNQACYSL